VTSALQLQGVTAGASAEIEGAPAAQRQCSQFELGELLVIGPVEFLDPGGLGLPEIGVNVDLSARCPAMVVAEGPPERAPAGCVRLRHRGGRASRYGPRIAANSGAAITLRIGRRPTLSSQ